MAVTETTTEGWGSRLGSSIKGVLTGLALFVAGFPLLFWNEGNAVKTAKAIDEGEGACVSLESNEKVDAAMEGKLVHLSGKADTKDVLADDVFGVSATAIRLQRQVEMFQWIEESKTTEKKKLGGGVEKTTTYTYKQDWSPTVINSGNFKEAGHDNPAAMEFSSEQKYAANVTFGAFRLSEYQIRSIGSTQAYAFPTDFVCKVERVQMKGSAIYVPNNETRMNPLNIRDVASKPRVGDMRVTFRVVYPHDISLIAKQKGDSFIDYTAKTGKKLNYLVDGVEDATAMFATARKNNAMLTWLLRLVGFLAMYIGLGMVFKPLSVLADVLPILGDIVGIGTGIVAGLIAFVCAVVTIAIAWITYRPVLGITLLVLAVAGIVLLIMKRRAKAAAAKVL
ncbi:MAG: TMEM43 family protein [Kiritimatiellae bacterium]|nr:TMEM43 family protein [Kiritimatiellia bacterium]